MFDTPEDTKLTSYITRLDVVEIDSFPGDAFVVVETIETINESLVEAKLLRNNEDHFLWIKQEGCPKFVIKREERLLELLKSIETLNIGSQGI